MHICECRCELIFFFCFLFNDRLTHAMAFIVIILLPINPISLPFGQRLGVAGNHYYCYSKNFGIKESCLLNFFFVKYVGFLNLEVQFMKDLFRIWHLQLADSYRKEDPL